MVGEGQEAAFVSQRFEPFQVPADRNVALRQHMLVHQPKMYAGNRSTGW